MDLEQAIFVAGHRGLVGSAIVRRLQEQGCSNIVTAARDEVKRLAPAAVLMFFRQ